MQEHENQIVTPVQTGSGFWNALSWVRDLAFSVLIAVILIVFIYQPVKVGARDGKIYVEVHKDIYGLVPATYLRARQTLEKLGWLDRVDLDKLVKAVEEESGVVTDISAAPAPQGDDPRRVSADSVSGAY